MDERLRASGYIRIDETPIQVINSEKAAFVEHQSGDPEAYSHAREIVLIFSGAKVKALRFNANQSLGRTDFGAYCVFAPKVDGNPIASAFQAEGVYIANHGEQDLSGIVFGTAQPNFYVFVGPKPPLPIEVVGSV